MAAARAETAQEGAEVLGSEGEARQGRVDPSRYQSRHAELEQENRKLWITVLSIIVGALYRPAAPIIKILAPTHVGGQAVVDALEPIGKKR